MDVNIIHREGGVIISEGLRFSNWTIERKVRSLELMDDFLRKHANQTVCDIDWRLYGGGLQKTPEETAKRRLEIAQDETAYINALFCFYVCCTTDFSWLVQIGK